jgi:RND superfamily putative drug exporter
MVLVPATMALLGKANWWLPTWLDRVLPHLSVEKGEEGRQQRPPVEQAAVGARSETLVGR